MEEILWRVDYRLLKRAEQRVEDGGENMEEKQSKIKETLKEFLLADDLVRLEFLRGELSREEASKMGGHIYRN